MKPKPAPHRTTLPRLSTLLIPRLAGLLFLALTLGLTPDGRGDEGTYRAEGYQPPGKGPLVSELREDVDPKVPGPETIIRNYADGWGGQVREFIMGGAIYQIEVVPYNGLPYLLIDKDGDGLFETRFRGNELRLIVPQWVLFRF